MSITRSLAMADLDTQIQQAQAIAYPPTQPPGPNSTSGPQERTTSQYPTERLFPQEPETLKLIDPFANRTLSPNIGPPPPPPRSTQNAAARAQAAQKAAQQQQRSNTRQIFQGINAGLGITKNAVQNNAKSVNSWLANIPTPGDVWTPFFILLALFLIIIPVKGHTRLMWLWLVIIGHAHIGSPFVSQNSQAQEEFQAIAGSSSGQSLTGTIPSNYPIQTYTYNPQPTPTNPPSFGGNGGLQLQPPSNPGPSGGPIPFVNYMTSINQEY